MMDGSYTGVDYRIRIGGQVSLPVGLQDYQAGAWPCLDLVWNVRTCCSSGHIYCVAGLTGLATRSFAPFLTHS